MKRKRRVHITKPATASQILRALRVTKADVRAALRALRHMDGLGGTS